MAPAQGREMNHIKALITIAAVAALAGCNNQTQAETEAANEAAHEAANANV